MWQVSTILCSNVCTFTSTQNSSGILMQWNIKKTIKQVREHNKLGIYKHELQRYHIQNQKCTSTDTVNCIQCKLTHSGYHLYTRTWSYLQTNSGTCAITLDKDTATNSNSIHSFIHSFFLYSHSINPQKATYETIRI